MLFFEKYKFELFLILVGSLFYFPFLDSVHLFDWDEINFAECSREMLETGNYLQVQINYLPFWEKPPFFFWLQVLSMKLLGINEFSARFPNAICGIITLIVIFRIGKKIYNELFGLIWAGCYFGSFLPHIYFKSGIIDPYFNLFIFLGLYNFILFYFKKFRYDIYLKKSKWFYLFLIGFWIALAMLTKGAVAYLIVILCLITFWIIQRFKKPISILEFVIFSMISISGFLIWYGIDISQNGLELTLNSIKYQYKLAITSDSGHKGFFGYHFIVLLIGCFPISIFAIRGLFKQHQPHLFQRVFKIWMLLIFWIILLLFSIVKTKILHYSSLCYFPITFLGALTIYQIVQGKEKFKTSYQIGLISIGFLVSILVISVPFIGQNLDKIRPFIKDDFALANLNASVEWSAWHSLSGIYFLVLIILSNILIIKKLHKNGFTVLLFGTGFFLMSILHFAPKIEQYSQNTAVNFFKSLEGKECYILTVGYKSYAHYFYAKTKPNTRPKFEDSKAWKNYLLHGKIDKDAYFVTKITKEKILDEIPDLKKLKSENGFSFYVRKKKH